MTSKKDAETLMLRDLLSLAHATIASAEEWAEEIQHAGYAVPTGRESEFGEFWDRLHEVEREIGEALG